MASESLPPTGNRPLRPEVRDAINAAVQEDSVSKLKPALDLARSSTRPTFPVKVAQILRAAVEHNSPNVLAYLIANEGAKTSNLYSFTIQENGNFELFDVLIRHGWDINQQDEEDGKRVIDWSCSDENMVRWLVEHGARVDNSEEEEVEGEAAHPPPLLETCARVGSLSTFKYLQDCGAKLSRRTLHLAASAGALVGADPANVFPEAARLAAEDDDDGVVTARKNAEDILIHLKDQLNLDLNAMDTVVTRDSNYCGTPINYAAKQKRGAAVVIWLLRNGADPSIQSLGVDSDGEGKMDAEGYAKWQGCNKVLEALQAWNKDT